MWLLALFFAFAAQAQDRAELFQQVSSDLVSLYGEEARARGKELAFNPLWEHAHVAAFAEISPTQFRVDVTGGLIHHQLLAEDSLAMALCHELGHYFGGAPRKRWSDGEVASVEGQADYFSTLKCFRRYAQLRPLPPAGGVDLRLVRLCSASFTSTADFDVCVRSLLTAERLGIFMERIHPGGTLPTLTGPERNAVWFTVTDGYPSNQCRLDTLVQGALCPVPVDEALDDRDPNKGACHRRDGRGVGARPRCWFNR